MNPKNLIRIHPNVNVSLPKSLLCLRLVLQVAAVASLAPVLTGCQSTGQPASASFASVTIPDRSQAQIHAAADEVFQADGYRTLRSANGVMVFEKEASKKNQFAYSGLAGSHYGEKVMVRVYGEIEDLGPGSRRLQCRAVIVRSAGDSFFEEEVNLANFRSGPYQKLLDAVANRLK